MTERWHNVPGFGDHYMASSLGRIKSKARIVTKMHRSGSAMTQLYNEKILEASPLKHGHLQVHISINNKKKSVGVHTMVLLAFKGPKPPGMEACHWDGDSANNKPGNLRWDTHVSNNGDRKRHGRYANKEKHPMAKLTPKQVNKIKLSKEPGNVAAARYGVGTSQISRIRNGHSWA